MTRSLRFLLLLACTGLALRAQSTVPVVSQAMPARTLVVGGAALSINLADYFSVPGVTGTVAQFDTVLGKVNVELLADDAPNTVENFVNYLSKGAYTNGVIHRTVPNFVVQGGGFVLSGTNINGVTTDPAIQNEFKLANTRGTIAMAKTDLGPDTATSQWFFNLKDNPDLNTTNGGYTVFGRVLGSGMTSVVDQIGALPRYDVRSQLGSAFGELPLLNNSLTVENLILVRSINLVPVLPLMGSTRAVVGFEASAGDLAVVTGEISASTLTLRPAGAGMTTVLVKATDSNGNQVQSTFTVNVVASPTFTTQPASQAIAVGGTGSMTVAATGSATYQWQWNGRNLTSNGALVTGTTVNLTNMSSGFAGLYAVAATSGTVTATTAPAIVGVTVPPSNLVVGSGTQVLFDARHLNNNVFDQVLLEGTAAAIRADYSDDPAQNQITRMSYIDLDGDIVQVEFTGPGSLSLTLADSTGPAAPTKYNQPSVSYMTGHASIVVTGADERTNLTVFTVGRATAVDPTGGFNVLQGISETNNPQNNGSSLFIGHAGTEYDGIADISRISITSTNGKFGGLRAANANFYDVEGYTGVYAPGVEFQGPVFVGDITAHSIATPVLIIGGAKNETRITGGDLLQANGQPVHVSGVTQLRFTAGSDSHGNIIARQTNRGILHLDGVEKTTDLVVYP